VALLLRTQAHQELARSFYRDVANEYDYFYIFVGKTTTWEDEPDAEIPVDTEYYSGQTHRNMMFVKRVQASDVVQMIRRIDWIENTVYDQYEDDVDLSEKNFYVLTTDNRVYKCLDNNSGSPSLYKPANEDVSGSFILPDGYIWKYMFTLEASDELKFLTPDYIPVRKMAGVGVPLYDINGYIDDVTIVSGGSGYVSSNPPTLIVHGDGNGGAVTVGTITDGEITSVNVTSGSGYSFAYVTAVDNGTGSGAEFAVSLGSLPTSSVQENIEAAAVPGTVDRISIIEHGENYAVGDVLVSIIGDGDGAEAVAEVDEYGRINSVVVTNQGTGYTFANIEFINVLGGGTGATAKATISPYYGHGANAIKELQATTICISVNLTNNTSDYFLNNDYRQLGIVKNILDLDGNNFSDDTGTTCYVIAVDDVSQYNMDDEIWTNTGGRFIVAQIKESLNLVYLLPNIPHINSNSLLSNKTTNVNNLTINSVTVPDVINVSGEILYVENRKTISREQDQIEKIRTVINF
jgi:hypothetical protein